MNVGYVYLCTWRAIYKIFSRKVSMIDILINISATIMVFIHIKCSTVRSKLFCKIIMFRNFLTSSFYQGAEYIEVWSIHLRCKSRRRVVISRAQRFASRLGGVSHRPHNLDLFSPLAFYTTFYSKMCWLFKQTIFIFFLFMTLHIKTVIWSCIFLRYHKTKVCHIMVDITNIA